MSKIYILGFSLLLACNSPSIKKNKDKESSIESSQTKTDTVQRTPLIEGVWAENEEGNAVFEISGDSIYYMENPESNAKFEIKGDSLIMYSEGLTLKNLLLKQTNDSLVYGNEYGYTVRLYKRH